MDSAVPRANRFIILPSDKTGKTARPIILFDDGAKFCHRPKNKVTGQEATKKNLKCNIQAQTHGTHSQRITEWCMYVCKYVLFLYEGGMRTCLRALRAGKIQIE